MGGGKSKVYAEEIIVTPMGMFGQVSTGDDGGGGAGEDIAARHSDSFRLSTASHLSDGWGDFDPSIVDGGMLWDR